MLYTGQKSDPKPEKYSDYKNRAVSKFENRAQELFQAIKFSSLRPKDKELLNKKISELFINPSPSPGIKT